MHTTGTKNVRAALLDASPRVRVTTGSRLHFGMFSFGNPRVRQFGGVGAMIDEPGVELSIGESDRLEVEGPHAGRVRELALRIARLEGLGCDAPWGIVVHRAPLPHVGLGSGTQLALALASGIDALLRRPARPAPEIAAGLGRGERSAIGLHGFEQGGLLVEAGKTSEGEISPLVGRASLPTDWRFVLIGPVGQRGISGDAERRAFAALQPVSGEATAELAREALLTMLPAAVEGRFDEFSQSLFQFGRMAGRLFAAHQGGHFATPEVAAIVELVRSLGVQGVAQSSWGPTVAALLPDEDAARRLVTRLRERQPSDSLEISIAQPKNDGARIETHDPTRTASTAASRGDYSPGPI